MLNTVQKVKTKKLIKDPYKIKQIDKWKTSDFNKVSAEIHRKEKTSFDSTTVFLDNCLNFHKDEIESMLASGINIDCCDKDNLTALHQACINGKLDLVEYLLSKNANINAVDKEGWTPLHIATSISSLELAKFLIEHGARLDIANYDGDLPISFVDEKEDRSLKVYLQKQMDKQNIDEEQCRNLERTVMMEDVLKWKKSRIYNPPIDTVNKSTPLHVASSKNYLDILAELIPLINEKQLNAQDSDGWTSLHAAAHWGNHEACVMLIKAGADVDIVTNANETVLDTVDPLLKDQLTEEIDNFKRENLRTLENANQISIRNDPTNKRRTSIVRQSVEWKKNTQSKDPVLERQIKSNAIQDSDLSPLPKSSTENTSKLSPPSLGSHNISTVPAGCPSIYETDESLMEQTSARIIDESKSHVNSITSPSVSTKKNEFDFDDKPLGNHQDSSCRLPDGDTITPEDLNVHNNFDINNEPANNCSETSPVSTESEGHNQPPVTLRPRRLSLVMAPSKCDESEANRREKARRVRSNRRSTQGIDLETMESVKRRQLEIINAGVTPVPEPVCDSVPDKPTKEQVPDVKDYSPCKSHCHVGGVHIDSPRPKLQYSSSMDSSGQKHSPFSNVLPKAIIGRRLQSFMNVKQSPENISSLNSTVSPSVNNTISPAEHIDQQKKPEQIHHDMFDSSSFNLVTNNKSKVEDCKEVIKGSDSGSFVAKPVLGISRMQSNILTPVNFKTPTPDSSTVKSQNIVKSLTNTPENHYKDSELGKTIGIRLANDIIAKQELQIEISKLKEEIQELKDNKNDIDSTLKKSKIAQTEKISADDKISILELELTRTKEENKKLKLQNEALLRVISKIQQDLDSFHTSPT